MNCVRKTQSRTRLCFALDFQLDLGLSRLNKAQVLCGSPRDINHCRIPRFHSIVDGHDNALAVIKICHLDLGSVRKRFVRRRELVLVINCAACRLFSLQLVAVEVRDALLGGLSGGDPKVPRNRKTHDSDHYAKLFRNENFHLELLSSKFVVQPIERTASTDSLGQPFLLSQYFTCLWHTLRRLLFLRSKSLREARKTLGVNVQRNNKISAQGAGGLLTGTLAKGFFPRFAKRRD